MNMYTKPPRSSPYWRIPTINVITLWEIPGIQLTQQFVCLVLAGFNLIHTLDQAWDRRSFHSLEDLMKAQEALNDLWASRVNFTATLSRSGLAKVFMKLQKLGPRVWVKTKPNYAWQNIDTRLAHPYRRQHTSPVDPVHLAGPSRCISHVYVKILKQLWNERCPIVLIEN